MPKRKNTRRVTTEEVMGEDSYVVVAKINAKTGLKLMGMSAALEDSETVGSSPELVEDIANTALANTREWNWVDNDGEPLPPPDKLKDPMEVLTLEEVMVLVSALTGSDSGNSESESPPTSDSPKTPEQ